MRVKDRATVEDVTNHWWVNWGCDAPICDCLPSRPVQRSEWHQPPLTSATGHTTSKRLPSDPHFRLTFPPKRPISQPLCTTLARKPLLDKPLPPTNIASLRPTAHSQAAKMPKKGILKKRHERVAHSTPSEKQAGSADVSTPPSGRATYRVEGQGTAEEGRRRKGILKRNSKFTSGAKPTVMTPPSPSYPESLQWDPDPGLRKSHQRDMENSQEEELER